MASDAQAPDLEVLPGLVARIAEQDEGALALLYDATCALVHGMALRMVRDPATAEEITLEVYMQVWRTAANYDSRRGSVRAWLATAARSRSLDWIRSRPARARREGARLDDMPHMASSLAGPEDVYAEGSRAEFVRRAMSLLPPEQRTAIDLGFFSGLSQSEIAETLGLPLGTVKSRMRLGMIRLREVLRPLQGGAA